jgi:hypothetical protein
MYLVFYRTTDVFEAEEILQTKGIGVEISPTPVQDKAYCGVCVFVKRTDITAAEACLAGLEYKLIP